jgi:hypothetical protein
MVCGAHLWSKQRQIMESVRDNGRTAVPACHGPGKSFLAAQTVAWWVAAFTDFSSPGQAIAVTSAPTFRQVKNILWPEIRRAVKLGELPGQTLMTAWKVGNENIAWGFSAADSDETAFSGIHRDHVLIVIDEGGGISDEMGRAITDALTGFHTRALVIGNPAMDRTGSWFENICEGSASGEWNTIRIPYDTTPNFTDEEVPAEVARRLVDEAWVESVRREFGETDAYWVARVAAEFPKLTANVTLPIPWIEAAEENDEPAPVPMWKLGVDIASDGGDELAIARLDPDGHLAIIRVERGEVLQNAVDVAGMILDEIQETERLAGEHAREHGYGTPLPIRVKIDAIGLGWGPVGTLQAWADEQIHPAEIVGVNVAKAARHPEHPGDPGFRNQRAEMYWAFREAIEPRDGAAPLIALDLAYRGDEMRHRAQLSSATHKRDSQGRIQIEAKASIKSQKGWSPDRAESLLLAVFEPEEDATVVEILA